MMLAARGIFLATRRKPRLPYDAEVEYLESTGTQWIDTGIVSKNDVSYRITCKAIGQVDYIMAGSLVQGVGSSNNRILCYYSQNRIAVQRGDYGSSKSIPFDTQWHTYYSSKDLIKIDNQEFSSAACGNSNGEFYLFTSSPTPSSTRNLQISKASIYDDGVLVRDFVPVRYMNENGQPEGAMYDRVSGQLFRNAGTGAFNYGNDK